jgi:hypothetical protein
VSIPEYSSDEQRSQPGCITDAELWLTSTAPVSGRAGAHLGAALPAGQETPQEGWHTFGGIDRHRPATTLPTENARPPDHPLSGAIVLSSFAG